MEKNYLISIDQSTQGTKALLFDRAGKLVKRADLPHRQIINDKGWISHDPEEIYQNTVQAVKNLVEGADILKEEIMGIGISNQRETSLIWDKGTGKALNHAIVWQCSRASLICDELEKEGYGDEIRRKTGIRLSPFFPAAKLSWLLKNTADALALQEKGQLGMGTIDTWLLYRLTGGKVYATDYSNASRTQLFNLTTLKWDDEICRAFGIRPDALAAVCDSDSRFGETDFEGFFEEPIPISAVMGDSHAALFGHGCVKKGMMKVTYGTGSSIMMNAGKKPVFSEHGIVSSLAWGRSGKVTYVLEGNINYTGAVISWLKDDVQLIDSAGEVEKLAGEANPNDTCYLVPAFSGLGAPYWNNRARACLSGISRTTGKREIVKAALESIAYQINDVVEAMEKDAKTKITGFYVDGGPTRNGYLMQFQSDICGALVHVPDAVELSGFGAAYLAGISLGLYDETVFENIRSVDFVPTMDRTLREKKYQGWKDAINML